jgi:hypothetical protein
MARTGRAVDVLLVGLAIASRVSAIAVLQSYKVPRSIYEHGEIAANLLAGRGFAMHFLGADGPTSQQAPVYPALVALAYAIAGVEKPSALLLLQATQAILGGVLVLGVLRVARLVAPNRRGLAWCAGVIVALHPTLIYAATHVQVAALGTTLLVWTLAFAYQTGKIGRDRDAIVTGGLLAFLALTDPILTLAASGIVCAVWLGRSSTPGGVRATIRLTSLVALTALVGISPWLLRNAVVHGEFVAIKSTFGYAFWQGNCAQSEGTDKVVRPAVERVLDQRTRGSSLEALNRTIWAARHEAGYLDDIALTRDDYRRLGSVSEPERSRILGRRALAELAANPGRYTRLCLRRLGYFVLFDETNPKSRILMYRVPHVALTVLAALGFVLAGPALRVRLLPALLAVPLIAVFHTLTITSARFHIPIEPLLALSGAAGFSRMAGSRGDPCGGLWFRHGWIRRRRLRDRMPVFRSSRARRVPIRSRTSET